MKFCFLILIVQENQIRFSSYNDFGDAKEQGDSKCFRKGKDNWNCRNPLNFPRIFSLHSLNSGNWKSLRSCFTGKIFKIDP